MLPVVEQVAEELKDEELEIEIVVPSLLAPLPRQTLLGLLSDRPRVAIIEETHVGAGFGAELAAALLEGGFQGRLRRIGTPPLPIPAARSLESQVIPDKREIIQSLVPLFSLRCRPQFTFPESTTMTIQSG